MDLDQDFTNVCVRYEEAIPILKEGLALNLDVPHALNALVHAYYHTGKIAEAFEASAGKLDWAQVTAVHLGARLNQGQIRTSEFPVDFSMIVDQKAFRLDLKGHSLSHCCFLGCLSCDSVSLWL